MDSCNASVLLVVQCGSCLPLNNKWVLGGEGLDEPFWDIWFCRHAGISLLAWKVIFASKESPTSSPWRYLRQWQRGVAQPLDSFYCEVPRCAKTLECDSESLALTIWQAWSFISGMVCPFVVAWFTTCGCVYPNIFLEPRGADVERDYAFTTGFWGKKKSRSNTFYNNVDQNRVF